MPHSEAWAFREGCWRGTRPRRSQVSHRVHSLLLFILCTKTRGGLSLGITDDPYFVLYNVCVFQNDYRKMYSFSLKKCKAVMKKQEQEGDAQGEDHGLLERGQSPTLTHTHPCPSARVLLLPTPNGWRPAGEARPCAPSSPTPTRLQATVTRRARKRTERDAELGGSEAGLVLAQPRPSAWVSN